MFFLKLVTTKKIKYISTPKLIENILFRNIQDNFNLYYLEISAIKQPAGCERIKFQE